MQISVTFRHMEPSEVLRNYAIERVKKVKKFLEGFAEANVTLSIEKFRHTAEVNILANGAKIVGQEETNDMYSAIDLVMDKIEKQVKKHREKVKDKKSVSNIRAPRTVGINILSYDRSEGENAPRIIKSERYLAKPMYLDEAVMQLDVLDNEFLVFTNAESETINVIYKRKDGDYGLIEPEPK